MQLVWVPENLGFLMDATVAHIVLTVLAVGVGFILSFPLALAIYRDRRLSGPITAVEGVLYTIPSLALFAFLVPFTGLSLLTAKLTAATMRTSQALEPRDGEFWRHAVPGRCAQARRSNARRLHARAPP